MDPVKAFKIPVRDPGKIFDTRCEAVPGGNPKVELRKNGVGNGHLGFGHEEVVGAHLDPGQLILDFGMSRAQEKANLPHEDPEPAAPSIERRDRRTPCPD